MAGVQTQKGDVPAVTYTAPRAPRVSEWPVDGGHNFRPLPEKAEAAVAIVRSRDAAVPAFATLMRARMEKIEERVTELHDLAIFPASE